MAEQETIKLKVYRYNPEDDEEPYYEDYEVPYTPSMKVLQALIYINENYHANIAFRYSCREWLCGSCTVLVDGRPGPACKTDAYDGMTIEPMSLFPVIRDLVVDRSLVNRKYMKLNAYLERIEPLSGFQKITAAEMEDFFHVSQCIECLSCINACPVVKEDWSDFFGPMYMVQHSRMAYDPRDQGSRIKDAMFNGLYYCTSCGACEDVCPHDITTTYRVIENMRKMAVEKGLGPLSKHSPLTTSIKSYDNPWQMPRSQRDRWTKSLKKEGIKIKDFNREQGEVLYFVGCTASYDPKIQDMAKATARIFHAAGVDFGILGKNEKCCGSTLLRVGERDAFERLARENVEAFKKAGVKKIVTSCAGCCKCLRNDFQTVKDLGMDIPVVHTMEFLVELLKEGKLKMTKSVDAVVTYHDPCHIGRHCGIFEPPREVLRAIPGVKFVELERHHENSWCCGAGGGVKTALPEITDKLSRNRIKEVERTGADILSSACPFCYQTLDAMAKNMKVDFETYDIVELVEKAL